MGVLFVSPNWSAVSEAWIARQIEALEPHVVAIAAWCPEQSRWRGRIPGIRLSPPAQAWWRRLAGSLGVPAKPAVAQASAVLERAIAEPRVSVVLVHYLDFAVRFQALWSRIDKPVFVHPHGYDTQWDYHRSDQPDRPYFPADYPDTVSRLSQRVTLIANSQTVERRLLAIGVPRRRIVLQYYGIPAPDVPPERPPRTRDVEVLYLGRLVDCKGPDLVIRAFELAAARGLNGRLTLAGDGYLRTTCELLRRRSRFADRIRLLGAVDQAAADRLRAAADIFTAHNCRGPLTRQEESFGVSVVEAMAAGLPVVTGRSGGVCETVVSGETGFLFEPGDVEAHATVLLQLAHDPDLRQRMGKAGHAHVREMFSCARRGAELRRLLGLEGCPGGAAGRLAPQHHKVIYQPAQQELPQPR